MTVYLNRKKTTSAETMTTVAVMMTSPSPHQHLQQLEYY